MTKTGLETSNTGTWSNKSQSLWIQMSRSADMMAGDKYIFLICTCDFYIICHFYGKEGKKKGEEKKIERVEVF